MNTLGHLAVVMDGNRRWARKNGILEKIGYLHGTKTIQKIIEVCIDEGIKNLTLFAFSTENWQRPKDEVEYIFNLFEKYLDSSLDSFMKNDVRFRAIGDLSKLDSKLLSKIKGFESKTLENTRLCVNVAISYGAKDEIVRAVRRVLEKGLEVNEANIQANLDLSEDVDLLLRVGNAKRISNFLLWQCAYAEIFFSDTLFPGLTKREFKRIIKDFKSRKRTFGK
ncbi:di-trans,poly-cis-decaprenylcistransferase [Helicobacter saguini]|uniref:Isoprenyl transferase n=1 Tax=Helicobacter saguini TaxID=1548018 RepID=A0A347VPV7_9HELI|nr:polyprenyl diphosphate synthase [Helicobacter saguini]MWV61192.1 di-trans,poly-cis-decaprenylcistransferase [Helicobacter saguini]MWV68141.1 di-trans,poly-cis-decaprenylcistransferase [Helicobacter saguini]MWV70396.1 di-trans,poly-cis-decaprenylcistransferase [Helicobacter saguini]MWV72297.1 di-trans,poly-cis-decaprenylcistransferase [Helicobacter saguini]TLD95336.1 di-trans,poly-cis-decaprenylcistransferase [Helicobacter saguini]